MLKDIFFYPLALIIVAVIIGGALSLGDYEVLSLEDIRSEGFVVEGADLAGLTASPGTNFDYIEATSDMPAFARLFTTLSREDAPPSPGVFAALNSDYEAAFAQQLLRLTITARSSPKDGLGEFDMAYFTAGSGDSGWQTHALSSEWADYRIEFRPGALNAQSELDYASIWPGVTGEPLMMDVKSMRVEILNGAKLSP